MALLFIVRGLPGSGKSTQALHTLKYWDKSGFRHCANFEADQYFMKYGEYCFKQRLLPLAHAKCLSDTFTYLSSHDDARVIVSNTFTTRKELRPYIEACEEFGHDCAILTATGNYKSVHNVPDHVIDKMKSRWEDLPRGWKKYEIN